MNTKLKLSDIVKTNSMFMLNNWTFQEIREKYNNSINEYFCEKVSKWILLDNINIDITYNEAIKILYDKFSTPIESLNKDIKLQKKMGQENWFIDELKESVKYYKNLLTIKN
jgi:hypothetical protein